MKPLPPLPVFKAVIDRQMMNDFYGGNIDQIHRFGIILKNPEYLSYLISEKIISADMYSEEKQAAILRMLCIPTCDVDRVLDLLKNLGINLNARNAEGCTMLDLLKNLKAKGQVPPYTTQERIDAYIKLLS